MPVITIMSGDSLVYVRRETISLIVVNHLKPQYTPVNPDDDKFELCVYFAGSDTPIHFRFKDETLARDTVVKLFGEEPC